MFVIITFSIIESTIQEHIKFCFSPSVVFLAIQTPNQQSEVASSSTTMSSIDEKQTTKDYQEIPGKTVDTRMRSHPTNPRHIETYILSLRK